MDFMDLLLAEAIAAGMARQAAEARQRPPPDNFFILPPDSQAWRKLYAACNEEHMVICVEITDDSHPGSRRAQPLFVELAREIKQIPFFRVKIGFGKTYDELRQDLGGIRFTPTIMVVFFDDKNVRTNRIEGEADINLALKTGAIHRVIKDYLDDRVKLKMAEELAENLFKSAVANEVEKRKRQAQIEYERKLEMERKELARQKEERKQIEDEKQRRLEAEKREEEELARRKQALEDKRSKVEEDLLQMDLHSARIRDIKDKMDEGNIGYVGATSRADLLAKLKNRFPRIKAKLESEPIQSQQSSSMSGYSTSNRYSSYNETDGGRRDHSNNWGNDEVSCLNRKVDQLQRNLDEMEGRRIRLMDEKEALQRILQDKESEIAQKNRELDELKNSRRSSGGLFGSFSSSSASRNGKEAELEKELIETRLLYSCVLDDMDILGVIARPDGQGQGMVVRAKCIKKGLPDPSRVYAMKVISGAMDTSTFSTVRNAFKTEYEILSGLPHHKNIIKLLAFFYDRPKTHPKLKECGEGMALCILMEQLSQNMNDHLAMLKRGAGPSASKVISWLKDVVEGLNFLMSHHIFHRDMKLDNLLISGDVLKISDFGKAICLDSSMKLPFMFVCERGGNEAHLAPEILNIRSGPNRYLDYSKQPVWEAGVLAYELAGHHSPFERTSIDQRAYSTRSLPKLVSTYCQDSSRQQGFPPRFATMVQQMLEFDAADRPTLDDIQKEIARF